MPNSVDKRIVEMQFDNAQFEKKVKQSIGSLKDLDRALEMENAGKGFERVEAAVNNLDFSKMEKSLSFLEYRFSALGMTSAKIIDRMTSKIGGLFKTLESNTIGQIKSGGMSRALKLEHANFMLDGILKDAKKVKDVMDNAVSPAVDGTAYGLDAAANAASQMVASGIQDVKKLETALSGISGVAAMSGSEYEDIAHIFTKVASSGRAMGDTFMELSTRGINATAVLSDYLKVSAEEVEEMRKKGQINFELFSNAMHDAYAEQAKKANDTFTGAMANMKAALSRIGADFATPYLNNMREIFNALRLTFNNVRKTLKPVVAMYEEAFGNLKNFTVSLLENKKFVSLYQNGIKILTESMRVFSALLKPIGDGFKQAFPEGMLGIISNATEKFARFLETLEINPEVVKAFGDFLGGIFSLLKVGVYIVEKLFNAIKPFFAILNPILGGLVKILGLLGKLTTYLANVVTGSEKFAGITKVLKTGFLVLIGILANVVVGVVKAIKAFKELPLVQQIFADLGDAAERLGNFALPLLTKAATGVVGAFALLINIGRSGIIPQMLAKLHDKVYDMYTAMKSGTGVIQAFVGIFKGGFKNLPRTVHAASGAVNELNKSLDKVGKPNGILSKLSEFRDFTLNLGKDIGKVVDGWLEQIKKIGLARGLITVYAVSLSTLLIQGSRLAGAFKKAVDGVPSLLGALKDSVKQPLFEAKAKAVIAGIAVSLLSLAGALFIISKIPADRLRDVTDALLKLIITMGSVMAVAAILSGGMEKVASIGVSMITFAGAITLLASSMAILGTIKMSGTELLKRVGILGLIMIELAGVFTVMTRLGGPVKMLFGSSFFIAFAYSIKMLVGSLSLLGQIPYTQLQRNMEQLTALIKSLAVVAAAATFLNPVSALGFAGVVAGILGMILGVNLLAKYIDEKNFKMVADFIERVFGQLKGWLKLLAWAKIIKNVAKAMKEVTEWMKGIAKPITAFKKAAEIAAKALKKLATAGVILSLTLFIKQVTKSLQELNSLTKDEFRTGFERLAWIIVAFGAVMTSLAVLDNVAKEGKFIEALAKSAAGLGILIGAIGLTMKLVASIPPNDCWRAAAIVGGIVVLLGAFELVLTLLTKDMKPAAINIGVKTALALSVLIGSLSLCIALLSYVAAQDWVALIAAAGSVAGILLSLGVCCVLMSKMGLKAAISSAIALGVFISALGYALNNLKDVDDPWKLAIIAGEIIAVIGGLALVMKFIVDKIKNPWKVAGLLTVIGGLVLDLGLVLKHINDINTEALGWDVVAIIALVGGISMFMDMLSSMKIQEALTAGGEMIVIAGAICFIAGALKELGTVDVESVLWSAFAMGVLSAALGAMGAVIAGMEWWGLVAIAAVVAVAYAITLLGDAAIDFSNSVNVLCEALNKISGEDLIDIGGGFVVLGTCITMFMGAIIPFAIANIALAAFAFVLSRLNPLVQECPEAYGTLGDQMNTLAKGFEAIAAVDLAGLFANITKIVLALGELNMASGEADNVSKTFNSFADALTQFDSISGRLATNLKTIVDSCNSLKDAITNIGTAFDTLGSYLNFAFEVVGANAISHLADALKTNADTTLPAAGTYVVDTLANGMKQNLDTIIDGIADDIISGLNGRLAQYATDAYNAGYELTDNLGYGMQSGVGAFCWAARSIYVADSVGEGLVGQIGTWVTKVVAAGTSLTDNKEGLGKGMDDGIKDANVPQKANDLAGSFLGQIEKLLPSFATGGKACAGTFLDNLTEYANKGLENIWSQMPADVKEAMGGSLDFFFTNPLDPYSKFKNWTSVPGVGYIDKTGKIMANTIQETTAATNDSKKSLAEELSSLADNAKGTKANTKAKKENKEANDKKTKAIDEETEALGEEEEAAEDNSEAIREMAEQIEVVTEKYHEWQGTNGFKDTFGTVKSLSKALGKFWSTALGKDKLTSAYVNKVFKPLDKNLKMVSDTAKKGIYAFDENGKYLKKLGKVTKMSNKEIEAYVSKTGKTVTKVLESEAVTYRKFGNTVEKTTSRVTKSVKNMAKFAKEAKDFNNWMAGQNASSLILNAEGIDQITDTLRKIEKYNTTLGKMNQQTQDYLGGIRWKMGDDLAVSMNALGRAMDGYASGWNKNSQTLAYTEDAFLSLAAALYDGSEAANEYATEEARLMFLFENGEATWEEVEEHHVSYIQRIIDALKEYRDAIEQNLRGSLDVFSAFNKNLMPEGTDLISNIESQIAGYTNWGNMLMELSKRGMNANLLKQLTDEGVQSYGKLAQLLKMSRGELALFNQRYKETEAAIAHARDMSLSAVANATTLASQRAAAASGKMTKAQLKASKKAAKEMINDAKAVADNQVRYKALTVKEEEHYLKNLTEEAKKAYHEQVKASKKLYKEEQKLAKKEEERRKKEARNDKIIGKIKNYKSLIKILRQYSKDAETTTMVNKKFAEAFKEVDKSMVKMNGTSVKSLNRGLLRFAETLEETGNESNNYFQEMAERVKNYVKSVNEAIKSNIDLTKSYETAEKTSMMKTLLNSRLTIIDEKKVSSILSKLVKMGYNNDVIKMLTEYYTNNGAAAFVAFADGYVNASKEQVQKTNAMYDESKKLAEKNAKAVASANAASFMDSKYDSWKKQKEKLSKEKKELSKLRKSIYVDNTKEVASQNQQINELEKQKLALMNQLAGASKNQKKQILADISSIDQQIAKTKKTINKLSAENGQTKLNKEIAEKDKQLSEVNRRIAAEEQRLASLGKRANDADKQNLQQLYRERNALQQTRQAMVKENSDNLKKEADLNTKIAKDETAVAKAKREMMEADAVQFRKLQLDEAKAATVAAKAVVDADKKEVDSAKKKAKAAKKARQKIEDELKKEKKKKKKDAKLIVALENELAVAKANEATANANLEVLQEALTESTKKYTDAKNKEKQATENLTKAEKDRAKANQEMNEILHRNEATDNLEKLIKLSKELGQSSKVFKAVAEAMTKPLSYFEKMVTGVLKNGNISNLARNMARYNEAISDLDYGLIRFAEHLGAAATNALGFGEAVAEALSDYEGTLRSALQSSSDFFSKFNGYADEKNPLTAMDYVNYADSQIKALEEWQAAMLKLSDRGLAKEIVESFASEGLNSYEKVMAWVKASDHEIAEYNHLYKQHTELIASSTDAAFTSVIAGYSRAGEALQNALMNSFAKGSLERLTEIVNDDVDKSLEMVINGVANGVNNAMPKIVEIVKKEDGTIVETVVSSTGEALSNSKVVSTLSNGVNGITTKATTTAGTTISSFADNVATNLMTKSTTTVDAMVNEAVNKFKMAVDTINSYVAGIRTDFTVRIHVDTTEIDAAINKFNNAVNSINASANTASATVKNATTAKTTSAAGSTYVDGIAGNGGVTYIQNNYSPKALDRSEIYRMTNNQLTGYTVAGVRY